MPPPTTAPSAPARPSTNLDIRLAERPTANKGRKRQRKEPPMDKATVAAEAKEVIDGAAALMGYAGRPVSEADKAASYAEGLRARGGCCSVKSIDVNVCVKSVGRGFSVSF